MSNKFIQFELWKDCRNNCKFCFLRGQKDHDKEESLDFIKDKLNSSYMDNYNEIGFIGGEIFDNQISDKVIRTKFYDLFHICREKIRLNKLDKIYVATALVYDVNEYLIPFIELLIEIDIIDKVLLCTSYDSKYRFRTKKMKDLWESNMKLLHKKYPQLKLHTEIIITQYFIDDVLSGAFSIEEFSNKFNTSIDYIEPTSGLYYLDKKECCKDMPDFFPSLNSFISFMEKTAILSNQIDLSKFLSMDIRSNTAYCTIDDNRVLIEDRTNSISEFIDHEKNQAKYEIGFIDSDYDMRTVVEQLYRSL